MVGYIVYSTSIHLKYKYMVVDMMQYETIQSLTDTVVTLSQFYRQRKEIRFGEDLFLPSDNYVSIYLYCMFYTCFIYFNGYSTCYLVNYIFTEY